MKVFKVLRVIEDREESRLVSWRAEGELMVEYEPNQPSEPPHPKLPLLAFDNYDNAREFAQIETAWTYRDQLYQIWEAEAIPSKIVDFYFISFSSSIEDLLAKIEFDKEHRLSPFPFSRGTVFCDSITLKRRIS